MGYDYCIRIAVDVEYDIRDDSSQYNEFERVYSTLLQESDLFPTFGEVGHTSSGGYGTGPNEYFEEEIFKFTSLFPQYSFFIYFFYWDMAVLEVFSIQGSDLQRVQTIDVEDGIPVPGGRVFSSLNKSIDVNNEILSKNT